MKKVPLKRSGGTYIKGKIPESDRTAEAMAYRKKIEGNAQEANP